MATYYVIPQVGGASDSNAGSKASPWLTLQKAANTMTAGDTLYAAGNWTYREQVTMATSGSSGSPLSFIGDITGEHTGYGGLVIITAHDSDDAVSTRASALNFNGKTLFEWKNCIFVGGTSFVIGNTAFASGTAYEGVVIENCVTVPTSSTYGVRVELNAGVTPTASGLKILRSTIHGGINLDWDSNGTAHVNLKILIDGCRIFSIGNLYGIIMTRTANGGAFSIGGVTITNNFIYGTNSYSIYATYFTNTTNVSYIFNNIVIGASVVAINFTLSSTGVLSAGNNVTSNVASAVSGANEHPGIKNRAAVLLGGLHDQHLYQAFGYSPYMPFEPMTTTGYTSPLIDTGHNDYAQTLDSYGNPRNMGRGTPVGNLYIMDGSDAAVTDPNNAWSNEANVVDVDASTYGSTNVTGSTSSNYIKAEGANAPASGGTIAKVQVRLANGINTGSPTGGCVVYTDGEAETLATLSVTPASSQEFSTWTDLSTPSGGWTWAKVQALEFRAYRTSASGTWRLYQIQIGVVTEQSAVDIGAVEARAQPVLDSTVYRLNTNSAKFPGAGYHNDLAEVVSGVAVKISRWVKWDANYAGTKPQMVISNIPGVDDITVTASGSADTWYELTTTFTPTASGAVLVKIKSNDASTNGNCWFADDSVTFP